MRKKKGTKGCGVVSKLDMSKTYDRIERDSLTAVMNVMRFNKKYDCLLSVNVSHRSLSNIYNRRPGENLTLVELSTKGTRYLITCLSYIQK